MKYKNSKAAKSIKTRDVNGLEQKNDENNIYVTINILTKRANQINFELKTEASQKLEEFNRVGMENLEEIIENDEQIEVSRSYERLPKSTAIAIDEYESGQLYITYKHKEGDQE
jgi:DNA-directed RNA polymerase subunit K/omega